MADHRANPLTPQDDPALAPLVNSHEDNEIEAGLKALFISLYETYIRPVEREINTLGTPHLGPMSQVERATKAEGLALVRRSASDDAAMRYVFQAWRARNPKRGLHMLRAYLQMLWPNSWTAYQMWQSKAAPYPTALSNSDGGNHYLTSRVHVMVSSASSDGSDVAIVAPALRSVLPARMLLELTVAEILGSGLGMGAAYTATAYTEFNGTMS
jgi:hypothetical protein